MTLPFRNDGPSTAPTTGAPGPHPTAPMNGPVHDARQLTGPDQTGYILLDGKLYTLRITRAGKLILTK